jgi:hypothetical protein
VVMVMVVIPFTETLFNTRYLLNVPGQMKI